MHANRGFTLTELLTTLAIVSILSTIAAPSFAQLRLNSARTAAVNQVFHAVFLARSEAIKSNRVVTMCKSRDGRQCARGASTAWTDGFIVFVNADRDEPAQVDPGEDILLLGDAWKTGQITSNREAYSFRPYTQGVVNGTLVFCDGRGSGEARAIIISHTGRPRISQRDASNRRLPCST